MVGEGVLVTSQCASKSTKIRAFQHHTDCPSLPPTTSFDFRNSFFMNVLFAYSVLLVEFGEQSPAFGQMMGSNERSISISIDNQLLLISY